MTEFVGKYRPTESLSNIERPMTYGAIVLPDYYMEVKRQQADAMAEVPRVLALISDEYAEMTGRRYDAFETYRLEDADTALVMLG